MKFQVNILSSSGITRGDDRPTDRPTDRRTKRQTDIVDYRRSCRPQKRVRSFQPNHIIIGQHIILRAVLVFIRRVFSWGGGASLGLSVLDRNPWLKVNRGKNLHLKS